MGDGFRYFLKSFQTKSLLITFRIIVGSDRKNGLLSILKKRSKKSIFIPYLCSMSYMAVGNRNPQDVSTILGVLIFKIL